MPAQMAAAIMAPNQPIAIGSSKPPKRPAVAGVVSSAEA